MAKEKQSLGAEIVFKFKADMKEWGSALSQLAADTKATAVIMKSTFAGLATDMKSTASEFRNVMAAAAQENRQAVENFNKEVTGGTEEGGTKVFLKLNSAVDTLHRSMLSLQEVAKGISATVNSVLTGGAGGGTGGTSVIAQATQRINDDLSNLDTVEGKARRTLDRNRRVIERLYKEAIKPEGGAAIAKLRAQALTSGLYNETSLREAMRTGASAEEKVMAEEIDRKARMDFFKEKGSEPEKVLGETLGSRILGVRFIADQLLGIAEQEYAKVEAQAVVAQRTGIRRVQERLMKEVTGSIKSGLSGSKGIIGLADRGLSESYVQAAMEQEINKNDIQIRGFRSLLTQNEELLQESKKLKVVAEKVQAEYNLADTALKAEVTARAKAVLNTAANPIPKALAESYKTEMLSLGTLSNAVSVTQSVYDEANSNLQRANSAREDFVDTWHKGLQKLIPAAKKGSGLVAQINAMKGTAGAGGAGAAESGAVASVVDIASERSAARAQEIAKLSDVEKAQVGPVVALYDRMAAALAHMNADSGMFMNERQGPYNKLKAEVDKLSGPGVGIFDEIMNKVSAQVSGTLGKPAAGVEQVTEAIAKSAVKRSDAENAVLDNSLKELAQIRKDGETKRASILKKYRLSAKQMPALEELLNETAVAGVGGFTARAEGRVAPLSEAAEKLKKRLGTEKIQSIGKLFSEVEADAAAAFVATADKAKAAREAAGTQTASAVQTIAAGTKPIDLSPITSAASLKLRLSLEQYDGVVRGLENLSDEEAKQVPRIIKKLGDEFAAQHGGLTPEQARKAVGSDLQQKRMEQFKDSLVGALLKSSAIQTQIAEEVTKGITEGKAAGTKVDVEAIKKAVLERQVSVGTTGITSLLNAAMDPQLALIKKVESDILSGKVKIEGEIAKLPGTDVMDRNAEGYMSQILGAFPKVFPTDAVARKYLKTEVFSRENVAVAVSEMFFGAASRGATQLANIKETLDKSKAVLDAKRTEIISKFGDESRAMAELQMKLAEAQRKTANLEGIYLQRAAESKVQTTAPSGVSSNLVENIKKITARKDIVTKLIAETVAESQANANAVRPLLTPAEVESNAAILSNARREMLSLESELAKAQTDLGVARRQEEKFLAGRSKDPRSRRIVRFAEEAKSAWEEATKEVNSIEKQLKTATKAFETALRKGTFGKGQMRDLIAKAEAELQLQVKSGLEAVASGRITQGEYKAPSLQTIINDALGLGPNAISISGADQEAFSKYMSSVVNEVSSIQGKAVQDSRRKLQETLGRQKGIQDKLASPMFDQKQLNLAKTGADELEKINANLRLAVENQLAGRNQLGASVGLGADTLAKAEEAAGRRLRAGLGQSTTADAIAEYTAREEKALLANANQGKKRAEQFKTLEEAYAGIPGRLSTVKAEIRRTAEEIAGLDAAGQFGGTRKPLADMSKEFISQFEERIKGRRIKYQEELNLVRSHMEDMRTAAREEGELLRKAYSAANLKDPTMGIVGGGLKARADAEAETNKNIQSISNLELAATDNLLKRQIAGYKEHWQARKAIDTVELGSETAEFIRSTKATARAVREEYKKQAAAPGTDKGLLQDTLVTNLEDISKSAGVTMRDLAQRMGSEFKTGFAESRRGDDRYYQEELGKVDTFAKESTRRLTAAYASVRKELSRATQLAPERADEIGLIAKQRADSYASGMSFIGDISRNSRDAIIRDREAEEKAVLRSMKSSLGYELEYHRDRIDAEKATIDRVVKNRRDSAEAMAAAGAPGWDREIERAKEMERLAARAKARKDDEYNQIKALHGPLQATARGLMSLSYQLSHVAMQAQMQGAALMAMVYSVVHFSAQYEKQMALLKGALEKVGGPTAKLKDDMKALAEESSRLGQVSIYGVTEIAETQKVLAHAGLTVNEIISATPRIMDMAAAGELKLAEAANTAVVSMRQFGLEASQMGRVTNVITTTAIATSSEVKGMAEALKYVGPIASNLGMSLEETTAALGLLANAGIKGSMGGTTLRRMLTALANPTRREEEVLKDLNIQIEDLEGNFVGLFPVLKQIEVAMGKASKVQISREFMQLFQQRAGAGAAALFNMMKEQPKVIEELMAATEEYGKDQLVAAERVESLEGAITRLKNSFTGLNVIIGEQTNGALKYLVEAATSAVQIFGDLIKGGKEVTSTMSNFAIGTAAVFGTALTFFATASFAISGIASGFSLMMSSLASLGSGFGVFKALYVGMKGLPEAVLKGAIGIQELAYSMSKANTAGLAFAASISKTQDNIETLMARNIGMAGMFGRWGVSASTLTAVLTGLQMAITGVSLAVITAGVVAGIAAWVTYKGVIKDSEEALVGFEKELNDQSLAPKYFDMSSVIRGTSKELVEIYGEQVLASEDRVEKLKKHLVEEVHAMALRNQKLLILQRQLETKIGWNTLTLGLIGNRHELQMELEKVTKMIQDTGAAMDARVKTIRFYGISTLKRDKVNVDELIRYLDESLGNKKEGISSIAGKLAQDLSEATQVINDWEQSILDAQVQSLALYYQNKTYFGEYSDYIKGQALIMKSAELGPNPERVRAYYEQLFKYASAHEYNIRNGVRTFDVAQHEELKIQRVALDKKLSMLQNFSSEAIGNLDKVSRFVAKSELNKVPVPDELKPERLGQAYRAVLDETEKALKTIRAEAIKNQSDYFKQLLTLSKNYSDTRKKQEQELADLNKPSNTPIEDNLSELKGRASELLAEAAEMNARGDYTTAAKLREEAAAKVMEALKMSRAHKEEQWKGMSEADKSYWARSDEFYRRTKKNEEELEESRRIDPKGERRLGVILREEDELRDMLEGANKGVLDSQLAAMELVARKQQKNRDHLQELNELSDRLNATWTEISGKVGLHPPAIEGEEGPENVSGAIRGGTLLKNYNQGLPGAAGGAKKEIDSTSASVGNLNSKVSGYVGIVNRAVDSNGKLADSLSTVTDESADASKFMSQLGVNITKVKPIKGHMRQNFVTGTYEFIRDAEDAGNASKSIDKAVASLEKWTTVRNNYVSSEPIFTNDAAALAERNEDMQRRLKKGLDAATSKPFEFLAKDFENGTEQLEKFTLTAEDVDRALAKINEKRKEGEKLTRKDVFSLQGGKSYAEYEKLLAELKRLEETKKGWQDRFKTLLDTETAPIHADKTKTVAEKELALKAASEKYLANLRNLEATTGAALRSVEAQIQGFGGMNLPPIITDEFKKALVDSRKELNLTKDQLTEFDRLMEARSAQTRKDLENQAENEAIAAEEAARRAAGKKKKDDWDAKLAAEEKRAQEAKKRLIPLLAVESDSPVEKFFVNVFNSWSNGIEEAGSQWKSFYATLARLQAPVANSLYALGSETLPLVGTALSNITQTLNGLSFTTLEQKLAFLKLTIEELAASSLTLVNPPVSPKNPAPVGRAAGGPISGYGGGDTVPAMLEPGEFVLRKEAVAKHGVGKISALNRGDVKHFATGGLVEEEEDSGFFGSARKWISDWNKKKDAFEAKVQEKLAPVARREVPGGDVTDQLLQDYHDVMFNGMNSVGIMAASMAAHPIDAALFIPKLLSGVVGKISGGMIKLPGQEEGEKMVNEVFHIPTAEELFANPLGPAMTAGLVGGMKSGVGSLAKSPKMKTIASSARNVMNETLGSSRRASKVLSVEEILAQKKSNLAVLDKELRPPRSLEELTPKEINRRLSGRDFYELTDREYQTLFGRFPRDVVFDRLGGGGVYSSEGVAVEALLDKTKAEVLNRGKKKTKTDVGEEAPHGHKDLSYLDRIKAENDLYRKLADEVSLLTKDELIGAGKTKMELRSEALARVQKKVSPEIVKKAEVVFDDVVTPEIIEEAIRRGGVPKPSEISPEMLVLDEATINAAAEMKGYPGKEWNFNMSKGATSDLLYDKQWAVHSGEGDLTGFTRISSGAEKAVFVRSDASGSVLKVSEPAWGIKDKNAYYRTEVDKALAFDKAVGDGTLYEAGHFFAEDGTKHPVFGQRRVQNAREATMPEIHKKMEDSGFVMREDAMSDVSPQYFRILQDGKTIQLASDIKPANVLVDETTGRVQVVDGFIENRPVDGGFSSDIMKDPTLQARLWEAAKKRGIEREIDLTGDLGLKLGGAVPAAHRMLAEGGHIPGFGGGDTVPAVLEPGEFVLRKEAVAKYGMDQISKMNKLGVQKFAKGGPVGGGVQDMSSKLDAILAALQEQSKILTGLVESQTMSFKLPTSLSAPMSFGMASGGWIPGFGGGDKHHRILEGGEFVLNKTSVRKYGIDFISAMNQLAVRPEAIPVTNLATASVDMAPSVAMASGGYVPPQEGGLDVDSSKVYNLNLSVAGKQYPLQGRRAVLDALTRDLNDVIKQQERTRR